jgi:hypothetical protein
MRSSGCHIQQRGVAVNDVGCDPKAGGLADDIVQPAIGAGDEEQSTIRLRSQPGIIKGQLPAWIDIIFGAASRRPVELINVAYVLVRGEPAGLTGAIGEDQDILGHVVPAASDPFCDLKRIHSDPEVRAFGRIPQRKIRERAALAKRRVAGYFLCIAQ